ncbi:MULTISPECIES: hypothetical protein [unclassified Cupriavidus]|nr:MULTISPECIES: hypothetical protein [unclassified Cupriavidus]
MSVLTAYPVDRCATKKSAFVQALAAVSCHEPVELFCDAGAAAFWAT